MTVSSGRTWGDGAGSLRGAVLAGLVLVVSALAGCSEPARAEAPADTRVPVEIARVAVGPVDRPIEASATLRAKRDYDLAFQVPGVVRDVRVDVGQRVRKGQVLAAIDPTTILAGLSQAEEGRNKASRDRARAELLGRSGAIPTVQIDDARTQSTLAEASLASARYLASNTVLVAPEDGFVDARDVEQGEVVAAGRPVLRLKGTAGGWIAVADLVDRDAVAVRLGTPARIHVDALPDRPLEGVVARIAPSASRGTGTFEVEIAVTAPPAAGLKPRAPGARGARGAKVADGGAHDDLLSGLTGRVAIERRIEVAARVPLSAIVGGEGDRGAVFVIEGGKARRREVRIAFLAGDQVALREPLGAGDVVSRGAEHLADGAGVRVVEAEAAGGAREATP
jgi:multidrug efflux system membrane fusion protein